LTASIFGAAGTRLSNELRALKAQIGTLQARVKDLESKQHQSDCNADTTKRQAS